MLHGSMNIENNMLCYDISEDTASTTTQIIWIKVDLFNEHKVNEKANTKLTGVYSSWSNS